MTIVACTPIFYLGSITTPAPRYGKPGSSAAGGYCREGHPSGIRWTGADNHVVPDFLAELRAGKLLSLADTRYVLVDAAAPRRAPRLEQFFSALFLRGTCQSLRIPSG